MMTRCPAAPSDDTFKNRRRRLRLDSGECPDALQRHEIQASAGLARILRFAGLGDGTELGVPGTLGSGVAGSSIPMSTRGHVREVQRARTPAP